jgi:hypothetical protein
MSNHGSSFYAKELGLIGQKKRKDGLEFTEGPIAKPDDLEVLAKIKCTCAD